MLTKLKFNGAFIVGDDVLYEVEDVDNNAIYYVQHETVGLLSDPDNVVRDRMALITNNVIVKALIKAHNQYMKYRMGFAYILDEYVVVVADDLSVLVQRDLNHIKRRIQFRFPQVDIMTLNRVVTDDNQILYEFVYPDETVKYFAHETGRLVQPSGNLISITNGNIVHQLIRTHNNILDELVHSKGYECVEVDGVMIDKIYYEG